MPLPPDFWEPDDVERAAKTAEWTLNQLAKQERLRHEQLMEMLTPNQNQDVILGVRSRLIFTGQDDPDMKEAMREAAQW